MSDSKLLVLKPRNNVTIEIIASPNVDNPESLYLWVNNSLLQVARGVTPVVIAKFQHMAEALNILVQTLGTDAELLDVLTPRPLPSPVTRAAWPKDPPIREWESEWPMNDVSLIAELIQLKSGFVSPNDIRRIADEALAFVHAMIPVGEKLRAGWMLESHRLGDNHPIVKETEAAIERIRYATTVRPIPAE